MATRASLTNCAEAFDAPVDSEKHQMLRDTAWMGGQLISVRYYLGRLIDRNLFRSSDTDVSAALEAFLADITSKQGAALLTSAGLQGWFAAELLLRDIFEQKILDKSSRNSRHVAAVRYFLCNPRRTDEEIARAAGTTIKQLRRNTALTALTRHTRASLRPAAAE